ncbi:phage tail tube protein [Bengtsoniella intestinalis]|uniref:phage tail tube protein n=1 Tax=Bengtsoniella intestinalis TaxID=3073143 RepID=UPI00391F8F38
MNVLHAKDTISGKEGVAYAKIDGNNEELFFAKAITASVKKTKSQVTAIGKRMVGHKTSGGEGTGSMTLYLLTPLFRQLLSDWKSSGADTYFDLVIENDDPSSNAGKQVVQLIDVNLDETLLAYLDGDSDDPLEEEVKFTFEDFEILTAFTQI